MVSSNKTNKIINVAKLIIAIVLFIIYIIEGDTSNIDSVLRILIGGL